jgi:transposase InsO family protein
LKRRFVYLAVVLDWFSRRVLSWRVSITREAAFTRAPFANKIWAKLRPGLIGLI